MVKMDMRKIEDTSKRMEGEDSLIEMQYRATICNDCKKRPVLYIIVRWSKRHPDYEEGYICRLCKDEYDRMYAFGLEPQGIVEVYNLQSLSTVG